MTKAEYRKKYLQKRALLSVKERAQMSAAIVSQLLEMPLKSYQSFMLYSPIASKNEVDINPLSKHLLKENKKVYLPKITGDKMEAVEVNKDSDMIENNWGILEPKSNEFVKTNSIEVFIIPLLICDSEGNRIGYGKGFYDKFLENSTKDSLKIGVNYFPPELDIFPIENTDIPLDYCVLPEEIVSFDAKLRK